MDIASEHTETAKMVNLPMGSPIPEWLLVAEPLQAGAPKGAWRFDCDVLVIELSGDFFVMPIIPLGVISTCQVLDITGMADHNIDAASKPVRVIHNMHHFFPVEYRAAIQAQREALAAQPMIRTEGPERIVLAPRHPIVRSRGPLGRLHDWWQSLF